MFPWRLQGLSEYRSKLAQINREHGNLQASLNEWRFRFRAEQRNFLLLVGLKYACVLVLLLVASFVVLGKAANFLFFALVVLYFVIRSEETNKVRLTTEVVVSPSRWIFLSFEKNVW